MAEVRVFASVDRSALQYLGLLHAEQNQQETLYNEDKAVDKETEAPQQALRSTVEDFPTGSSKTRWLTSSKVLVSLSPSKRLLAVAHDREASFMKVYTDHAVTSRSEIPQYKPCFCDQLGKNDGENITCLLVIDLLYEEKTQKPHHAKSSSLRRSMHSWPCVAVGHQSGHITFYTEEGMALLNQKLHGGAVTTIKCRTSKGVLGSAAVDENEQLLILYQTALVTIDGFSLLQTLRVCQNQLQKAQSEVLSQLSLTYKKWELSSQGQLLDIECCGMVTESLFDYLKEACTVGGYNTTVRGAPSAAHKYISVGAAPMIGVYEASQDAGQPLFSEVAVAMANRLKSAVMSKLSFASGWLSWTSKADTAVEPKVEPATPMLPTVQLSDPRRVVTSIVLSPNSRIGLTTDELGRVMLLDCENLVVTRIWKGYREAQCGFVTSSEDVALMRDHHQLRPPRIAMFVVIYAPRRGILEIWPAGSGSRIAAFNVGSGCRLLYNSCNTRQGSLSVSESVLVKSDGSLEEIRVPFYYTLSEQDRSSFADHHAVSKIQELLQSEQTTKPLAAKLIGQLQTVTYLKKVAYLLPECSLFSVSDLLDFFHVVRDSLLKLSAANLSKRSADETVAKQLQQLLDYCYVQTTFLELYQGICDCRMSDSTLSVTGSADGTVQQFQETLELLESEATSLWSMFESFSTRHPQLLMAGDRVVEKSQRIQPGEFLNTFLFEESNDTQCSGRVSLREKSMFHTASVGTFLITPCLSGQYPLTDLLTQLMSASVKSHDVMDLLFACLLATPVLDHSNVAVLQQLCSCVREISSMYRPSVGSGDHVPVSSDWWRTWIYKLENSPHPYRALVLSSVCCQAARTIVAENKKLQETQSDDDDWESVCLEVELWNVLVHRLEDLLCLVTVLHSSDKVVQHELTVARLMDGHQDAVTRLVAGYVVQGQFEARAVSWDEMFSIAAGRDLVADEEDEDDDCPEMPPEEAHTVALDERSLFLVQDLNALRLRFPNTLKSGILHVYCAYAAASLWTNDYEVVDYLHQSLSHVRAARHYKSELCSVLWKEIFKEKIQALALLTEKVGRAPKDRLCRKSVELSSNTIPSFVDTACLLLEEMQKGVCVEDVDTGLQFQEEQLWCSDRMDEDRADNSLWRKVCHEPKPNSTLIRHHHLLCLILHAITSLSLKSIKPLSLFDSKVRQLLFSNLTSEIEETPVVDRPTSVSAGIQSFLYQIVTSSVSQFSASGDANTSWLDRAIHLCDLFQCDTDPLRRLCVQELYKTGLDSHAEEFQLAVKDRCCLGRELLPILGWRLSTAMAVDDNKQKAMAMIPHLPPGVFEWLKSCKELMHGVAVSSSVHNWMSIKKFATVVMSLIPDAEPEHSTAERLADALASSK